ncbi:hypothetical protein [Candidatus Methanoperedens nitratireducens]|nr:hypothetical protein [Candidatus Methanoperedens nitroreducens]
MSKQSLKLTQNTDNDAFINDLNLFLQTDSKLLKTFFTSLKLEPSKEINDELENLSKLIPYDLNSLKRIVNVGNFIFTKLEERKVSLDEIKSDFEKLELKKENFEKIKSLYEDFGKNYAINRLKYDTIQSSLYAVSPKLNKILHELNVRVIKSNDEKNPVIISQIPVASIELRANVVSADIFDVLYSAKTLRFTATIEDLEKTIDDLNKIKLKLASLSIQPKI